MVRRESEQTSADRLRVIAGALPLAGIRVLDLTHMLAGPYCTLLLADLGCDVIKVEAADRADRARSMPGCTVEGQTAYFGCLNRNKRSVSLDLKQGSALRAFYRLVETAQVVVDNFRPGVTARLQIDFDELKKVNPAIVTCSITGFGLTGPRRDEPAYDYLIQALVGTMSLTGEPDREPSEVRHLDRRPYCRPARGVRDPGRASRDRANRAGQAGGRGAV